MAKIHPVFVATNPQTNLMIHVNLVNNDKMLCNTDTNMFTVYNFVIGDLQWKKKFLFIKTRVLYFFCLIFKLVYLAWFLYETNI